ncbi:hypothetical protein NMG60_11015428 [Bertholletia excelsa]
MASTVIGKSRILCIGGTGYLGKNIVTASTEAGHPTFALVRESTLLRKPKLIESFKNSGVALLYGDIYNHESMVKAIKQVDVVISTVSYSQIADQVKIIAAIKEAGNIKRFFPAEFGIDVDRLHAVEPAASTFKVVAQIRREVEAAGIPHTYVCCNSFAGYYVASLCQIGANRPPRDKVVILGDGNTRAIFNTEADVGTYTIRAVDDPRTLNKILYLRPPGSTYTFNELVTCWEKKIGKVLEKTHLSEEQVLKKIKDGPFGYAIELSILHSFFFNRDQTNFEVDPSFGVEASELYPDVKHTTVDEYLNQFV